MPDLEEEEPMKFEMPEDVRETGCLEKNRVRKILKLETNLKKHAEWMCFVEWMPGARDGGFKPNDSWVGYEAVKKAAPKVVVDYYERHFILE